MRKKLIGMMAACCLLTACGSERSIEETQNVADNAVEEAVVDEDTAENDNIDDEEKMIDENDSAAMEETTDETLEETSGEDNVENVVEELNEMDFVVGGNNSVTQNYENSVIKKFDDNDWEWAYQTFVDTDDFSTNRGITYPSTSEDVLQKYGEGKSNEVDLQNDRIYIVGMENGSEDVKKIESAEQYYEYTWNEYGLRFYFDTDNNLILVSYYKNYNMMQ